MKKRGHAAIVLVLLLAAAAAGNVLFHGALLHAWLAWPWWAQAASAVAAATLSIAAGGAVPGLLLYLAFAVAFLFARGPAPAYQVTPEFPAAGERQQDRQ